MLESPETFKADSRIMSTSSHQSTHADANAYPWGWLGVLGTVIVMMITGAGWLYQKNGEWSVPATQDPRNAALEQTPAAAATPSDQGSVAERVRDPSDVASRPSLLTPSTPPMQSEPAVAEPSAAPEPAPPLPETVDTEADQGLKSRRHGRAAACTAPPGDATCGHLHHPARRYVNSDRRTFLRRCLPVVSYRRGQS
jgi:hypothetical protein